jgi:hypothetical protein
MRTQVLLLTRTQVFLPRISCLMLPRVLLTPHPYRGPLPKHERKGLERGSNRILNSKTIMKPIL